MTTLTLTEDQKVDFYMPRAKDIKPGDVISGIVTDYTSPDLTKIKAVIKVTEVAHRGSQVRLFGHRLTTESVGREWSTKWIDQDERFDIPF